jgi:hypothetical protein
MEMIRDSLFAFAADPSLAVCRPNEYSVRFVDLFHRIIHCAAGIGRKTFNVLGNRGESGAHDLEIFVEDLWRGRRLRIHSEWDV